MQNGVDLDKLNVVGKFMVVLALIWASLITILFTASVVLAVPSIWRAL